MTPSPPPSAPRSRAGAWLTGGSADRARYAEVNARITASPLAASLVGASNLAAATVYGWPLVLLVLLATVTVPVTWHLVGRARHPEVPNAWGFALLQADLVAAVVLSGGATSPLLPLTLVPLMSFAVSFRAVVTLAATAATAVVVAAACAVEAAAAGPVATAPAWLELTCYLALLVCVVQAAHELASSDRAARGAASLDALTGLYNRRALELHFEEARAQGEHRGAPLGAVVLDVDHFKLVNDTHGHTRGDDVLREVVQRTTSAVRPANLVYRVGGEEFLVLLPGADTAACAAVAERVRAAVALKPVTGLPVTVSAGVCSVSSEGAQLADLVARADTALYAAKRGGRNRVCVATAPAGSA